MRIVLIALGLAMLGGCVYSDHGYYRDGYHGRSQGSGYREGYRDGYHRNGYYWNGSYWVPERRSSVGVGVGVGVH